MNEPTPRAIWRYALAVLLAGVLGCGTGHLLLGRRRAGWLWMAADAVLLFGGGAIYLLVASRTDCGLEIDCVVYSLPFMVWFNLWGVCRSVQLVAALLACRPGRG